MNLHGIVAAAIGTVNPFVAATVKQPNGYTTNDDGVQVPAYVDTAVRAQVQSLTFTDLQKLDGMNIEGVKRAVYLNGDVPAVIRQLTSGGAMLVFPTGTLYEGDVWLCTMVLEQWPDWCKIAITLQNQ